MVSGDVVGHKHGDGRAAVPRSKPPLSPLGPFGSPNYAVLACYVDLRRTLDRVWIAHLRLHSVSAHLTTPFLHPNGRAPGLVAAEVESHGRRGSGRNWRRNDAKSRGAESSEPPFVERRVCA